MEEHELAIGAGAFNPITSRVLEIKDSPAARHQAIRQHMLDALKEENTELLKVVAQQQRRLNELVEGELPAMGTDQDADLPASSQVPAASFNRLKGDFQRLKEEINSAKKRSDRMEEVNFDSKKTCSMSTKKILTIFFGHIDLGYEIRRIFGGGRGAPWIPIQLFGGRARGGCFSIRLCGTPLVRVQLG